MTIGIYKIENKINGKVYIGQSKDIETRRRTHINVLGYDESHHFSIHRAMLKHGQENFIFETLEECSIEELNEKEAFWVKYYDSYHSGYNETLGGQNTTYQKLSYEKVQAIKKMLLETDVSMRSIAEEYGVLQETISHINTGKMHIDEESDYPIRVKKKTDEEIVKLVKEELLKKDLNMVEIAEKFNITKHVVYDINVGVCFFDEEQDYPIRNFVVDKRLRDKLSKEDLLHELCSIRNFQQIANKYGKSSSTIRNWAKSYGLPTNEVGIEDLIKNNEGTK